MHPAQREGEQAGRGAAYQDLATGTVLGANVLVMASSSAAEWLADNMRYQDRAGECRTAYVAAYLSSYHKTLRAKARA